jgi:hypothetical protein
MKPNWLQVQQNSNNFIVIQVPWLKQFFASSGPHRGIPLSEESVGKRSLSEQNPVPPLDIKEQLSIII